jgi:hypothetical protein
MSDTAIRLSAAIMQLFLEAQGALLPRPSNANIFSAHH